MTQKPRRVALMLDLQWPYKRHTGIFAGTQQSAEARGWILIIDEFVHNTLPARRGAAVAYDGIIARANHQLVARASRLTELTRQQYAEYSWTLENYHRGIKRCTEIERCQTRGVHRQSSRVAIAQPGFHLGQSTSDRRGTASLGTSSCLPHSDLASRR